jgi:hypothetical protein
MSTDRPDAQSSGKATPNAFNRALGARFNGTSSAADRIDTVGEYANKRFNQFQALRRHNMLPTHITDSALIVRVFQGSAKSTWSTTA